VNIFMIMTIMPAMIPNRILLNISAPFAAPGGPPVHKPAGILSENEKSHVSLFSQAP
jgi:hypothetical protein